MWKFFKDEFEAYYKKLKFKSLVKKMTADQMNRLSSEFIQ